MRAYRVASGPVSAGPWLHLPVALILLIYLAPALLGLRVFFDPESLAFAVMLGVFVAAYYTTAPWIVRALHRVDPGRMRARFGSRLPWTALAWTAALAYVVALIAAAATTSITPLGAALTGGTGLEIAKARAEFLANREGIEVLLRYAAVILGRSVLPCIVAYLYFVRHPSRHYALLGLLLAYSISLEKASPLFVFLPLILLCVIRKSWRDTALHLLAMVCCVGLWAYLAVGATPAPKPAVVEVDPQRPDPRASMVAPMGLGPQGDPDRHDILHFVLDDATLEAVRADRETRQFFWLLNRIVWIPYVTAYDWLKFHADVMHGELNLGRAIGLVSWLQGKPRLTVERMVYEYQFGASPMGVGGANTVFFVDAKLAFGWPGVVVYCLLFGVFAGLVLSTRNAVVKVASLSSFFTAAVSSLSATLLSGGLWFYVVLALLLPASPAHNSDT